MDLVPWRSKRLILPRNCLFALAVALAAIQLPTSGAFGQEDLPNQGKINEALNELTAAEAQARDNVPQNQRVKSAEDALDTAKRANTDAAEALKAAQKVQEASNTEANAKKTEEAQKTADMAADAERTAEARADRVREGLKDRTTDEQKDRATKYRDALDKRRAARKKLQSLHAEVERWLGQRRRGIGGTKELEGPIIDLRKRIEESVLPVAPRFISALMSFRPMTANAATDAQTFCAYGDARPTPLALEPSDSDGNPLKQKLDPALGRALALALGKSMAPINISNPDGAPQGQAPEKSPQGPASGAPGPTSTEKPPAQPAASVPAESKTNGTTVSQPTPSTRPQRPDQLGLPDYKMKNGETYVEAIDRMTKVADEALARGDMGTFEAYRDAAVVLAERVGESVYARGMAEADRLYEADNPLWTAVFDTTMISKVAWNQYGRALEAWKSGSAPSATSPGAAAGATQTAPAQSGGGDAKPSPAATAPQSATPGANSAPAARPESRPEPAATPPRTAAPGEKAAPAPEKSASTEKEIGIKTPWSGPPGVVPASVAAPAGNITVHFKATEATLQGEPQGSDYKAASMKLTVPEPELPKAGRTKTAKAALDRGHDRSPVTCVAGAGGQCKAQLTGEDREAYQLGETLYRTVSAAADGKTTQDVEPIEHFRMEVPTKRSTGAVIRQSAAKPTPAQLAALAEDHPGVQITKTAFKIGNQAFTRVSFSGPEAATLKAAKKYADSFGADAQIDSCGDKAPGPPLGMEPVSLSALNQELPQATLGIRQRIKAASARR